VRRFTWIVIVAMPILVLLPEYFSAKCRSLLRMRNQISNMNSFVQERVTGMKIVQLFHREDIEAEKFKKHQR
jgi:ABC-type multidrug transport system fused ATPase/permease subunit